MGTISTHGVPAIHAKFQHLTQVSSCIPRRVGTLEHPRHALPSAPQLTSCSTPLLDSDLRWPNQDFPGAPNREIQKKKELFRRSIKMCHAQKRTGRTVFQVLETGTILPHNILNRESPAIRRASAGMGL